MEIVAARGKKKTNRKEQIELLSELLTISNDHGLGPGMAIKIKFAIIAALFDYNPKLSDAMKPDSWEKCMAGVDSLLDMMEQHETVVTTGELIMEENEVLDVEPYKIRGCYLTAVERLDEEFIKVRETWLLVFTKEMCGTQSSTVHICISRVPQGLSLVRIGTYPPPASKGVPTTGTIPKGGGGHTRLWVKGWGSPN